MSSNVLEKSITAGCEKINLLNTLPALYFMRAITAGLYLSLVVYMFWMLVENLSSAPFGMVFACLFFGVGLFVVIVTRAELFTSNTMYLATSSLTGKTNWIDTLGLWCMCYVGNLVGAVLFAGIVVGTGALEALPETHSLFSGTLHKIEQPATHLFFKGILANWLVCMAVWVGMHMRDDMSKFVITLSIISIFLYLGFEHSIANMGTFTLAVFAKPALIPLGGVAYNLLWVTLGNIVGGGVMVGAVYVWLDSAKEAAARQTVQQETQKATASSLRYNS